MALQNFVNNNPPTIKADFLNGVDVLKTTIFNDALNKTSARTALTSDAPMEVANGGTGARSASDARDLLGSGVNFVYSGVDSGVANAAVVGVNAPFLSVPQLVTGAMVTFVPNAVNTGPTTMNFAGTGALPMVNQLGAALTGGELSQPLTAQWTGAAWKIVAGSIPPSLARSTTREAAVVPTNYLYPIGDVRRYGADDTGVADSGPAFNSAYTVATALGNTIGGLIRIPAGQYKITTPVVWSSTTTGYIMVKGDGNSTKIINNVTGNPANPCILIQAKSPLMTFADFDIFGNGLTGASGNGHGIAFINPDGLGVAGVTTFYPQNITVQNVTVQGCFGTGKAFDGSSIPACGVYMYGVTSYAFEGCTIFNNQMGVRLLRSEKIFFTGTGIDGNSVGVAGAYVDSCQNISFTDCILNGAGTGGALDGCLVVLGSLQVTNNVTLQSSRAKDGNPFVVNLSGSASCNNHGVNILNNDLRQLNNGDLPVISAIPPNTNLRIVGNYFLLLSSATVGVGVQVSGSGVSSGLEIVGNIFEGGNGSTYANGVLLNSSSSIRSPVIRSNTFGNFINNTQNFTNCIQINGNCDNPIIQSNTIKISTAGSTVTNAVNLSGGGNVRWPLLLGNSYDNSAGGTLTNQLNNAGAVALMQLETGSSVVIARRATVAYSASMTPDASLGNEFDITPNNGTAFTINTFAKPSDGQRTTITIRNTTGGALGAVTWSASYKMSAWTQPANGFSRSIDFRYDGTNWVQISQTGVDVPN